MARGGYIKPEVAVARLYKTLGSRDVAKVGICDALVSGALLAKGRRILRYEWKPTAPGMLRDMATAEATLVLGDQEDIPTKYWSGLLIEHVSNWDWEGGYLRNPTWDDHLGYQDVILKEKDINLILVRSKSSSERSKRKEKLRASSWHDWVAAAAIIANENKILVSMTPHQLIAEINAKLQSWHLDDREKNTVLPAARAILERYKTHPPCRRD